MKDIETVFNEDKGKSFYQNRLVLMILIIILVTVLLTNSITVVYAVTLSWYHPDIYFVIQRCIQCTLITLLVVCMALFKLREREDKNSELLDASKTEMVVDSSNEV